MIALIIISFTIIAGLLYAQHKHYEFIKMCKKNNDFLILSDTLHDKLKEFEDVKKRVDALTIRAGFKL